MIDVDVFDRVCHLLMELKLARRINFDSDNQQKVMECLGVIQQRVQYQGYRVLIDELITENLVVIVHELLV